MGAAELQVESGKLKVERGLRDVWISGGSSPKVVGAAELRVSYASHRLRKLCLLVTRLTPLVTASPGYAAELLVRVLRWFERG